MQAKESFGLRLKWLGCSCFELDFGGVSVVNDPWITQNGKNGLTWEAVENCNYITLTHGHYDHTLDIPVLLEKFSPYVLCGENTAIPLMKWTDLSPMRLYPMTANLELDLEAVKIQALYGRHTPRSGGAGEREAWRVNHPVNHGDQNLIDLAFWGDLEYRNYLYTTPNGTKVLIWGNKLSRPDQRTILRQAKPHVALMQVTGGNAAADTADICEEMGCKVVIPHHFDFPKDYMPFVRELEEELCRRGSKISCIVPEYGKWISL